MALDSELLDILVCPKSKDPLIYFEDEEFLYCPTSQLKYPIKDDIPQMLAEEADEVSDEVAAELEAKAEERDLRVTAEGSLEF